MKYGRKARGMSDSCCSSSRSESSSKNTSRTPCPAQRRHGSLGRPAGLHAGRPPYPLRTPFPRTLKAILAAMSCMRQERAFPSQRLRTARPAAPPACPHSPCAEAGAIRLGAERGSEQQQPRRPARGRACTVCDMLGAAWRRLHGAS